MKRAAVRLTRSPTDSIPVGELAEQDRRIFFEFDPVFIGSGLAISPFKFPLLPGLIEHTDRAFGLLPGLFDDALPDSWGMLLMDRAFRQQGIDPAGLSPLDRLLYLGRRTMGALTFHPPQSAVVNADPVDLYALGMQAMKVNTGSVATILPELLRTGGSAGGARPKVLVGVKGDQIISGSDDLPLGFEHWLVKFPSRSDRPDESAMEFAYAAMAGSAGIDMPVTRLFETSARGKHRSYFGVRRFDRSVSNRRHHVHSFGNLIHANFRVPSTDYQDFFKVTLLLTRNHEDVLRAFRRMVFNIAAHKRDDHSKSFAFVMNDFGEWSLSPAFDLVFSNGPGGEHMMSVAGEGENPGKSHVLKLAEQYQIKIRKALEIIDETNQAVAQWPMFAKDAGCSRKAIKMIEKKHRVLK